MQKNGWVKMNSSLDEINKLEKRMYAWCAAGLLIGIVLLAIVWKAKGVLSTITGIAGILLILISVLALSYFVNNFYKIKGRLRQEETGEEFRESYIKWPGWLKKWGWMLHFIVIAPGIGLFASMHENDFGGLRFVWHSVVAGILAGILLYLALRLKYTHWASNKNKSAEIGFYIILAVLFVMICAGPVVNSHFARNPAKCHRFRLEPIHPESFRKEKYIHVWTGNRKERFKPPSSFFTKLTHQTDTVILCVRKGYLGYEYVEKFRLP